MEKKRLRVLQSGLSQEGDLQRMLETSTPQEATPETMVGIVDGPQQFQRPRYSRATRSAVELGQMVKHHQYNKFLAATYAK